VVFFGYLQAIARIANVDLPEQLTADQTHFIFIAQLRFVEVCFDVISSIDNGTYLMKSEFVITSK
jgi:hypothetical protein